MGAAVRSEFVASDVAAEARLPVNPRQQRQALAQLIQQHQRAVYGYLHARLLEPADAEDLCQEVFLRFYQQRQQHDRRVAPRAWLIGIARNVLREHVRRQARRREIAWTELCLELEDQSASNSNQDQDALTHLPVCLDSLGPSAREALQLKYESCWKLARIGEKLHRSEGAVKLLMHRARQALRRCIDSKLKAS